MREDFDERDEIELDVQQASSTPQARISRFSFKPNAARAAVVVHSTNDGTAPRKAFGTD